MGQSYAVLRINPAAAWETVEQSHKGLVCLSRGARRSTSCPKA